MDSIGPPPAPAAPYTNIASPTAKPPSSTPSRLPHGDNGGTRSKYHNKNRNSDNGGGHNGTSLAAEVVVALLARPQPPLVPTARPTHRGRPTATRGRGT
jgi:hypothetical protein